MSAVLERELELVEYLRVSFDESGRERSNDEQHGANLDGLERSSIGRLSTRSAYSDVGSASRFAKKVRGGFAELVADLEADRFVGDGLVLWESSRASRKASEWLELLELLAERGKVIVVTTHGPRLYDPTNDRDWRSLVEDAVDAEYESRKTSKRVGRSMAASAHAGKVPGGRRAFGYSSNGLELDPIEAPIVRECARRVLASESVRSIAGDLNRRGVLTSAGNPWHPGPLAKMLAGPRIAGLRTHHGRVVAVGEWPAIVDEATHKRLAAMLAARPRTGARGRSPWKATGLLRCELCAEPLVGNTDVGGTRRYVCRKGPGYRGCGRLTIKAEPLEVELGRAITVRLSDAEARRNADVGDSDDDLDELNRIAADRLAVAELGATLSLASRLEEYAALDRRQRAVEERLSARVHRTNALALVAVEELAGRPWDELEVDEARLLLGALIETVTVGPATLRGSTRFETARVLAPGRIVWRPLA